MSENTPFPICVPIVEAIATVEKTDPQSLDFVLHDHVDTESLENMLNYVRKPWKVTFDVEDHEITVEHDRTIYVDGKRIEPHS